jgi:hypothetical protein
MRSRYLALAGALVLVIVVGVVLAPVRLAGQADAEAVPRTPWGAPNLEGDWNAHSLTPLQRPTDFADKPVLTPEEEFDVVAAVLGQAGRDVRMTGEADVAGAYNAIFQDRADRLNHGRTGKIVDPPDGHIPPMVPAAQVAYDLDRQLRFDMRDGGRRTEMSARYNLNKFNRADGPEDRGIGERCLGRQLPVIGGAARITQSENSVGIFYSRGQGAGFSRVIPITTRPHLPSNIRTNIGDARAHWEDDTLVVDVTNFNDKRSYQGSRENMHLTERFTRIDANTLEYRVTVEDPTVWTAPWTVMDIYDAVDPQEASLVLTQQTCHEGNYGIVGVLSGHRAAERAFENGTGPDPFTLDTYSGGGAGDHNTAGTGIRLVIEE